MSAWIVPEIVEICWTLSKLYLKHYWSHFFPDTVYKSEDMSTDYSREGRLPSVLWCCLVDSQERHLACKTSSTNTIGYLPDLDWHWKQKPLTKNKSSSSSKSSSRKVKRWRNRKGGIMDKVKKVGMDKQRHSYSTISSLDTLTSLVVIKLWLTWSTFIPNCVFFTYFHSWLRVSYGRQMDSQKDLQAMVHRHTLHEGLV